jgi:hypothetical protein
LKNRKYGSSIGSEEESRKDWQARKMMNIDELENEGYGRSSLLGSKLEDMELLVLFLHSSDFNLLT